MLNAVKCGKKWHPKINKRKGDSQPLVIEVFNFSSFRRKPESSVFDIFPRSHALRGNYIIKCGTLKGPFRHMSGSALVSG
jgi:hypothetical protein